MLNLKHKKGFTLVELIVVVAIVGILTAIAYPSYLESARKTNRSEAKVDLSDFAQRLQRCYTAFGKFNDATNCAVYKQLVAATAPVSRGRGYYTITFSSAPAVSATTYTLVATAVKTPQTLDTRDGCNVLTLTQDGVKAPATCW
jgi:prepilin-type N-terminal cleavage/methylation domain-containing protein